MYFIFYIFDGWSIVKLMGSMFFLRIFLRFFRWMVGLEVDGPLGVVFGGSKGLCGWSWAAPRASVGGPGPLSGPLWVVLGRSQGLCGRSWAALKASVGGPGPLSGPLWAVLGRLGAFGGGPGPSWVRSSVLCWRSWAALGARSWASCWRSRAALEASVGGLGGSWGLCWRS